MRIFMEIAATFVVGLIAGRYGIAILRDLKYGQNVREEGLESHSVKQGTPTIGGLIFIAAAVLSALCFGLLRHSAVLYVLSAVLSFSCIGFLDDYLKILRRHNEGLTSKQKLALQIVVSAVLSYWAYRMSSSIVVPFWRPYDLGLLFIPLAFLMYVSITNAVNLTDGADGLATSVTLIVVVFAAIVAIRMELVELFEFSLILASALVAFFVYNWYPAKVFMGDTGSLALGGYVGAVSLMLGIPLFIPIFGIVYVVENLSVLIQVGYYKRTGKRVFKMAPIHHHCELSGWSEVRIVAVFCAVTAVFCFFSLWVLKISGGVI